MFVAPLPAAATSCEQLRADIEARIRGNGVTQPLVSIADAASSVPGRTVGTCDRGARKILYRVGAAPPRDARPVLTECADGRVLSGGDCRK